MKTLLLVLTCLAVLATACRAGLDDDDDWLARFGEQTQSVGKTANEAKARAAAESFLRAWLVEADIDKAVSKTDIALDEIVAGLWEVRDQKTLETWRRKWLTMWFYPDHAAVVAAGHGIAGKPGWAGLAEKPSEVPNRVRWMTTPVFTIKRAPATVGVHKGEEIYAVNVPMKSGPNDEVWLFLVQVKGRWKVMLLESTVRS